MRAWIKRVCECACVCVQVSMHVGAGQGGAEHLDGHASARACEGK